MAVKRFAEYRHFDDGERAAAYRASFRGYTEERLLVLATFCAVAFGLFLNMNDSPARIDPEEAAIAPPTATARRLVEASVSENTRRATPARCGRELHDVTLATYLAELHDAGRASSSASMTVAAACFRAKLADQPPTARRVPANRWRAGARPGAAVRGLGPGGRACHPCHQTGVHIVQTQRVPIRV